MKYEKIRKQVLDAILDAVDQGLIHGTSGNIAMRDDEDDVVAITPSGISYTGMTAEDIAIAGRAIQAILRSADAYGGYESEAGCQGNGTYPWNVCNHYGNGR
jgi:hypothetical protein